MSAFNAKAMVWPRNADFGQIRHGVEWRPAMFRVASVSVKCGRGGGTDLASIGDDDIPYVCLNNQGVFTLFKFCVIIVVCVRRGMTSRLTGS